MSMYPPPQAYHYPPPPQQQFPPQPRHQPVPAPAPQVPYRGYGAPSAPPAPSTSYYQLDPESFRRDYTSRLAELTMNSRPIIQDLSVYAQEYSRWSDSVVSCIDKHIRMVSAHCPVRTLPSPRETPAALPPGRQFFLGRCLRHMYNVCGRRVALRANNQMKIRCLLCCRRRGR